MYDFTIDKESIIIKQFGLCKFNDHHNRPYDAYDIYGNLFEIKTTSTHRKKFNLSGNLNMNHIIKWRKTNWIFGLWNDNENKFQEIYLVKIHNMKIFLDELEIFYNKKINLSKKIFNELIPIDEEIYDDVCSLLLKDKRFYFNAKQINAGYVKRNGILIENKSDLMKAMKND